MYTLGYKKKNVNKVQWLKIRDKHTKQNKVINMSALPPWQKTLKLHSVRANVVAKMQRSSLQSNINAPNFSSYGWDSEGTIEWVHNIFPNDMEIYFSILYLMEMISNLVVNARRGIMIAGRTQYLKRILYETLRFLLKLTRYWLKTWYFQCSYIFMNVLIQKIL